MSFPPITLSEALESAEVFIDGDWVESKDQDPDGDVRLIQLADVGDGLYLDKSSGYLTKAKAHELNCTFLKEGDLLVARMPDPLGRACIFPGDAKPAVTAVDVCIIRPKRATHDAKWLMHTINAASCRQQIAAFATGTTRSRISRSNLGKVKIPNLPPAEQRRIAEILDRAEALRAKRRAALPQLDILTESIFLDLFGDPATNPKGWELLRLQDVLSMPLRNGLSPSNAGKVTAKVLTLSAITGSEYDDSAWKVSTFLSPPPSEQSVDENDFLICRGNGNVRLVGKGYFPTRRMPDVTFPDTMIAARIRADRLERLFLQHIWNRNAVRRQVESLARTTNGTYKVNQTMLEGITFIRPPLELQREFARRVGATGKMKAAQRTSLAQLDALFAAFQHRAFRGEL